MGKYDNIKPIYIKRRCMTLKIDMLDMLVPKSSKSLSEDKKDFFAKEKISWLFSSVLMACMPIIFVLLAGAINMKFDLLFLFGNGELIFASFTMLSPLFIEFLRIIINNSKQELTILILTIFGILIMISQIFLYAQIKITQDKNEIAVMIISVLIFIISIIFANKSKDTIILIQINQNDLRDKNSEGIA